MTREAQNIFITEQIDIFPPDCKMGEFLRDMQIILEQEPCEDAISRQAVLDYISRILNQGTGKKKSFEFIQKYVEKLPSVNPQPKTGRWIEEIDDYGKVIGWHCNKCYEDSGFTTDCKWNHCPSCGAKMVEPQERSGEE